jgi:serine/threonine protein kinase
MALISYRARVETRKTIGRYEVRDCIGRGGMGALFRGHDPVLDREVAIKTMLADFSRDEDGRARFYREARAAARLQHRNIVTLFDFGEDEGTPYIVMEFLHGQTVAEYCRGGTRLSVDRVLDIGAQLCTGLHFAHLRGVVHRDIKPPNIWLNDDGGVKLLDFGIAKFGDTTVTRIGGVVGSVSYMSPEQVSGEEDVDGRSDIFSVGIVLYELLSGQRPFRAESPTGIMMKIVNDPPTPLEVPGLPSEVVAVIHRGLEKDRAKRYQHANEMAAELRNLQILVGGRAGTSPRIVTTVPIAPASAAAAAASAAPGPLHTPSHPYEIDGDFETHAGQDSPIARAPQSPADSADLINRWSLGTAEDLVADAVITPPEALEAVRRADARKKTGTFSAPVRGGASTEWLTRWPTLAAAGGAIAIAAFAAVLLMRAESSSNNGKDAAAAANGSKPPAANVDSSAAGKPGSNDAGKTNGTASSSSGTTASKNADGTGSAAGTGTGAPATESTDVRVLLSGPYAFSIVDDAGRSIAGPSQKHDLRLPPKQAFLVQAPQVYLRQRLVVDNKPGGTMNVRVPGIGELDVRSTNETCTVVLDGYNLGFPPIAAARVAAGRHTITLKCPDGDNQTDSVTIVAGEKETKRIQ